MQMERSGLKVPANTSYYMAKNSVKCTQGFRNGCILLEFNSSVRNCIFVGPEKDRDPHKGIFYAKPRFFAAIREI